MDLNTLQARLRQFAKERNWESYLNPKNLAMALTVEAAELQEIFQWMTPEQAAGIASQPEQHQHLGEEIADVLMYLVQLADRAGVDLDTAVERKLLMNARKHPPPSPHSAPSQA